ncbi:MAG: hypothetical protein JWL81_2281, partial [Verrucomicrobiales bacterium]|nr:hypothetical protein [Verrucomicrobiales bacterium]
PGTDTSSRTFTGDPLRNAADLNRWLTDSRGTAIVHHLAERLLTYALGHGLSPAERLAAHRLADDSGGPDPHFRDLLLALIGSPEFRGENAAGKSPQNLENGPNAQ